MAIGAFSRLIIYQSPYVGGLYIDLISSSKKKMKNKKKPCVKVNHQNNSKNRRSVCKINNYLIKNYLYLEV
tara:strand:- start:1583 stop:1795 length:213 start_codon:yes stop_codon:yes gene_type:complete